jgi:hypothetical protein
VGGASNAAAPNFSDTNYVAGVGVGGGTHVAGGNGLIVLSWTDPDLTTPEPGTMALAGVGALLFAVIRRKRLRR